jgi:hypothetical protein
MIEYILNNPYIKSKHNTTFAACKSIPVCQNSDKPGNIFFFSGNQLVDSVSWVPKDIEAQFPAE